MFCVRALMMLMLSGWFLHGEPTAVQGFGRFGRINTDGLLTLNVSTKGFTTPPTRIPITAEWASDEVLTSVISINNTSKRLKILTPSETMPSEIFWSILYPGFSAIFGAKAEIKFSGVASGLPIYFKAEAPAENPPANGFYWILITPKNTTCMPLLIAFKKDFIPSDWKMTTSLNYSTLTISSDSTIGEVRFITPFGMNSVPYNMSQSVKDSLLEASKTWSARLIPIHKMTNYKLAADKKTITVTDSFLPNIAGEAIAPIPPVLGFVLKKGYPGLVNGDLSYDYCLTEQGDFAYVSGDIVSYTLPIPPTDEWGYVKVPAAQERIDLCNSLVGHLGGSWISNAVDMAYAGMANAQMAASYLSSGNKNSLANAWKTYLPMAYLMPPYDVNAAKKPWKTETEPFSKLGYIWTYYIDGWGGYRYDIDWGNALPLYGTYKYAQYTGDWNFVRKNWHSIRKIYNYFECGDDWAWMTVVNGDHGYSTGTGDPMSATYCGMLAGLKMARAIGDNLMEENFSYRAARFCIPCVSRLWYTGWAREKGFIGSKSVVLGFSELEGYTRAQLGVEDPWNTTNILSGDGVLPELFSAFITYAKDALNAYENEYAEYFPQWYDGNYAYSFDTTYDGNSAYVNFPHIYARALLGETDDALWGYVDSTIVNLNNSWIAPNVVAELMSRESPLLLTEWQPAAYKGGVVSSDLKTVTLDFQLSSQIVWNFKAQIKPGKVIQSVKIGGAAALYSFENNVLTLNQLRPAGSFQAQIIFN